MGMKGLDDHIMGIHQTHYENVKHTCLKCGHIWEVRMMFDMGGWFYNNDDEVGCPKCDNADDKQIKLD